ncbi:hypothetical protein [Lederbergia galactosidilytica]|uniref:Phage protein n=1 Tax=Lederbergia galactosidilytica TaxID=217031 RepID=A0A177ZYW5_9BACI|nr:hypothetical protein [Lederbergia galactosidilytica]OAK72689.1 phage protein [Lederbergia galactosidilytica]
MAKLKDLVNVNINRNTIKIQGVEIPVIFTFESFPYLEQAYGKPYHVFEKDLNAMMKKGRVTLGKNEFKLMKALIYAMVRSGGTDCTVHELEGAISIDDLPGVFQVVLGIFQNQIFQAEDAKKIKTEKKS